MSSSGITILRSRILVQNLVSDVNAGSGIALGRCRDKISLSQRKKENIGDLNSLNPIVS